jgi:hypothetical protein
MGACTRCLTTWPAIARIVNGWRRTRSASARTIYERIDDSPATVGVTVIDVTPIHDRLIVERFEHDRAQPATSHGEMF